MIPNSLALARRLAGTHPVLGEVMRQHLDENHGEVLAHLFLADVRREVVRLADRREMAVVDGIVAILEACVVDGDPEAHETIGVSFVEQLVEPSVIALINARYPALARLKELQSRSVRIE